MEGSNGIFSLATGNELVIDLTALELKDPTLQKLDITECPNPNHRRSITEDSPYLCDKVPSKYFLKNPEDPGTRRCKFCYFCRLRARAIKNKRVAARLVIGKAQKKLVSEGKCETMYCTHHRHPDATRDGLPKKLFLRDPTNEDNGYFDTCADCRKTASEYAADYVKVQIEESAANGRVLCSGCKADITDCVKNSMLMAA